MNAWLFLIAGMIVFLLVIIVFIPVADEVLGLKCADTTGAEVNCFDATTTLLVSSLGILVIVAMLFALLRRFSNDLERETY